MLGFKNQSNDQEHPQPTELPFIIDSNSNLRYQSVGSFCGSICLWMECGGHKKLCSHEFLKFFSENGSELGVPAGHYGFSNPVKSYNLFKDYSHDTFGSDGCHGWHKMYL